jgi:hypothetical protein
LSVVVMVVVVTVVALLYGGDACELCFLRCGRALAEVFQLVFGAGIAKPVGGAALAAGEAESRLVLCDDVDAETHEQKMSRWIATTIGALTSADFWIDVMLANISRRPLMHLMRFLQSPAGKLPKSLELLFRTGFDSIPITDLNTTNSRGWAS